MHRTWRPDRSDHTSTRTLIGVAAVVALVVTACGGTSPSDEGAITSAAPAAPAAEAVQEAPSGGGAGSDAIKVHGHWRVDIVNPDGSLDRTVEFENALLASGAEALAKLLVGQGVARDGWRIVVGSGGGPAGPCASECHIEDVTAELPNPGEIRLSGSTAAEQDGTVGAVATTVPICDGSATTPADCLGSNAVFTQKIAGDDAGDEFDPVPVTAGQLMQFIVTLSFS